ncbi:CBU_0592 family membrane protein [Corynebacterium sp. 32222D000AT]|uniref:CBU_0592 family membrane protein n=1 Tax=unclassified Corynebacterium TaxID=2624378 RepID=UPI002A97AB65|nr:transporter [Mycobacteriaceae bacterium]MDY5828938.1 transporter [Corynebacterium sp.]
MSAMVIFGLIASVALLFAFAMLNLGKWTPDDYPYQILNFVGAGFLTASAANPFNAGVFWTELIWSLLGLYGIIKIFLNRRKNNQSQSATA